MFSAHPVHLVDREVAAFGYGHLFDGITAGIVDKVVSLQAFVSQKFGPRKTAYVGDLVHDVGLQNRQHPLDCRLLALSERKKLEKAQPDFVAKAGRIALPLIPMMFITTSRKPGRRRAIARTLADALGALSEPRKAGVKACWERRMVSADRCFRLGALRQSSRLVALT